VEIVLCILIVQDNVVNKTILKYMQEINKLLQNNLLFVEQEFIKELLKMMR
jgi:hypothetical protein